MQRAERREDLTAGRHAALRVGDFGRPLSRAHSTRQGLRERTLLRDLLVNDGSTLRAVAIGPMLVDEEVPYVQQLLWHPPGYCGK